MKRLFLLLSALLGTSVNAQTVTWPALPSQDFIAGRPATQEDVKAGRAVFVAEKDGVQVGRPIQILVPQYAWHKDGAKRAPVVVIQAEEANGQKIVGARTISGEYLAGLLFEFELLGQHTPKQ